jgi:hypothetical protein
LARDVHSRGQVSTNVEEWIAIFREREPCEQTIGLLPEDSLSASAQNKRSPWIFNKRAFGDSLGARCGPLWARGLCGPPDYLPRAGRPAFFWQSICGCATLMPSRLGLATEKTVNTATIRSNPEVSDSTKDEIAEVKRRLENLQVEMSEIRKLLESAIDYLTRLPKGPDRTNRDQFP